MPPNPFVLITPGATRGLGVALTRRFLRSTDMPVFATTRTTGDLDEIRKSILKDSQDVDPRRLHLLHLDLTSEDSIASAAADLARTIKEEQLSDAYIQSAFISGGMLVPEKRPADLDWHSIKETFQINVISHLLIIKHFSQFLPDARQKLKTPAKWVHISARVGSIEDNRLGGWYSYRSSKAALNQVVKTFDVHLLQHKTPAMCVAMHPGTMKTDLSKGFWDSAPNGRIFEAQEAANNIVGAVDNLKVSQRGQFWDWAGKRIPW